MNITTVVQDWSLDELCNVCAVLKIPYVVVVQSHLLRDKGNVRLRRIQFDSLLPKNAAVNESFVPLENLAATILSSNVGEVATTVNDYLDAASQRPFHVSTTADSTPGMGANLDCVYVDNDQYYENDKQVSKSDTPNWKAVLKTIKSIALRSESYMESLLRSSDGPPTAVIGANVSFWVLRDFGTCLMRRGEPSAYGACDETTEQYPKHKKVLKILAGAINNVMKKNGYWNQAALGQSIGHGNLATLLLYSKTDDRFDLVTLGDSTADPNSHTNRQQHLHGRNHNNASNNAGHHHHSANSGRKGRRDRRRAEDR